MRGVPKVGIKDVDGIIVNPATEEKQDVIITAIEAIDFDTTELATEAKQDDTITAINNIDLDTALLSKEAKQDSAITQLLAILANQTNDEQKSQLVGRWGSELGESDDVRIDASTNSLQTIDYAHHEIHAGNHYKAGFQDKTLDVGDIIELLFVTPDTTEWAHWVLTAKTSDGGATIEVFEDTVTSTNGTLAPALNRNRNVAAGNSTLVYKSPTVTTDGTKIAEKWIGNLDKKDDTSGSTRGNSEFMLKQNAKYLVRMTATSDNMWGAIGGDWYEHTDKH